VIDILQGSIGLR